MSGLFYVFLKYSPANKIEANTGRYMLCLNSRYEADELFRALQILRKTDDGLPKSLKTEDDFLRSLKTDDDFLKSFKTNRFTNPRSNSDSQLETRNGLDLLEHAVKAGDRTLLSSRLDNSLGMDDDPTNSFDKLNGYTRQTVVSNLDNSLGMDDDPMNSFGKFNGYARPTVVSNPRRSLSSGNDNSPFFTALDRKSAQFWVYDSQDGDQAMLHLQQSGHLPGFQATLSTFLLNDGNGGCCPLISNPVIGPDWVSGQTFFIRNRRQPNTYWWVHDTHIHTSEQRRTKFRIQVNEPPPCKGPVILVRKDAVKVAAIPETTTSGAVKSGATYIASKYPENGRLELLKQPQLWTLEELLLTRVGVRWARDRMEDGQGASVRPELAYMPDGGSDEWELA